MRQAEQAATLLAFRAARAKHVDDDDEAEEPEEEGRAADADARARTAGTCDRADARSFDRAPEVFVRIAAGFSGAEIRGRIEVSRHRPQHQRRWIGHLELVIHYLDRRRKFLQRELDGRRLIVLAVGQLDRPQAQHDDHMHHDGKRKSQQHQVHPALTHHALALLAQDLFRTTPVTIRAPTAR